MRWVVGFVVVGVVGCSPGGGGGTYTGEDPDAGPGGGGPDLDGIGTVCTYDSRTGVNPTNTCPVGLSCLIVSRDGNFRSGLLLDLWEDQTTIYREDGIDEGYCTLINPPGMVCPAGTDPKGYTGGTVACMRRCASASECGRVGYTCDTRWLDIGPTCVRDCTLDYPECVRTAVIANPADQTPITIVALEDIQGNSTCDPGSGACQQITARTGGSGPGGPCTTTDDCDELSVCIQGGLLEVPFVANAPAGSSGFCASACAPDVGEGACSTGFVCQAAGNLALGMSPFVMFNVGNQSLFEIGGFCFRQCSDGVPGNCDTTPGTSCGAFDSVDLGVATNGISMCLPDSLRR